jgi:phage/plasmid primase-like uncharacterized protein
MALTTDEVHTRHKTIHIQYRKFKKDNSTTSQSTWLQDLAEARAKQEQARMKRQSNARQQRKAQHRRIQQKQYTSSQELKKVHATEDLHWIYRNIKYAVGKDQLPGITLVIAPNQHGEWVGARTPSRTHVSVRDNNSFTKPKGHHL